MLIEECHPSSLPLEAGILKAYNSSNGRTSSSSNLSGPGLGGSGTSSGRIEKERTPSVAAVRKAPRMRKRTG